MYLLAPLSSFEHIIYKMQPSQFLGDADFHSNDIPHRVEPGPDRHYGLTLRSCWLDAVQVHQFKIEFHALMYNW